MHIDACIPHPRTLIHHPRVCLCSIFCCSADVCIETSFLCNQYNDDDDQEVMSPYRASHDIERSPSMRQNNDDYG